MTKLLLKSLIFLTVMLLLPIIGSAEPTLPYQFVNNSPHFADNEIYIGLVGKTSQPGLENVWVDFAANDVGSPELRSINDSYNTLHKVQGDAGYGNFFFKLSDIKNKTVHLPKIFGCRMYVAFKSPLYIKFYADGGFAGPSLAAGVADPSAGIRWELIELTWADNGAWVNTSRVDAYQYPMGLELYGAPGANNPYMKTGELISHSAIIQKWQTEFPTGDFTPCLKTNIVTYDNVGGMIEQPSKISEFGDAGVSKNYFQSYIDQIWSHFTTNDFVANCGDRGIYRGRINGSGELVMTRDLTGATAKIYGKPNTQEVIEGKGRIAEGNEEDKAFQAQFCGALNRGVIDITATNGKVQNWGDVPTYFTQNTYNKYVWFFHQADVSYDKKCYAFAYDDTWDQSATLVTSIPSNVKITIGGFYNPNVGSLASITVTPTSPTIASGATQLFTAKGFDANGNEIVVNPTWSCSTDGSINGGGLFTASIAKTYTVTATVGAISGSSTITVTSGGGNNPSACSLTTTSGHFTTEFSTDKTNPTFTFVPSTTGIGTPTLLLFYKVSQTAPDWGQVGANTATPNTPFQITANEGDKVYFYYVYSHPSGQQNSVASGDYFVVGSCVATDIEENNSISEPTIFPNPATDVVNISNLDERFNTVTLYDLAGKSVLTTNVNDPDLQLNIALLQKGFYTLVISGDANTKAYKIIKK